MGKSGSSAKQRVTTYRMSIHLGLCAGPIDALREVYVSEKPIGGLYTTEQREIDINKPDMFGGIKKEGGVGGRMTVLPGHADQLMTADIASKFGATPTTMEGFRGLASLFFAHVPGSPQGFYWIANSPYLRDIWATVTRVPRGWYPEKAAIAGCNGDIADAAVYIALDTSGSMAGTRLANMKTAVAGLLADLKVQATNMDYRMVAWGTVVNSSIERRNASAANYDELIAWTNGITTNGGTNFAAGVSEAATFFAGAGSKRRIVVFVTDGAPSPTSTADDAAAVLAGINGVECYGFNIDLTNIFYTDKLDNTPFDSVPVVSGGDPDAMKDAFRIAFTAPDANPVHMIVECMTNKIWGMGGSLSQFNLPVWVEAADTLYDEGLGLSMIWTQQAKIEDFVKEVLNHIEAYVFINPRTGLFEIKLIRDDYDPDTLTVLDETNCLLVDHQIKLYGESINEIVVTWTNPKNEQDETVTLQDPGAIAIQGSIVSDNRNYYGVRCREVAMELCERDLRAATAPLASATVDTERSKNSLTPGSVCKLNFPEHGIANRIMRVGPVDYGNGKSAELRLSLVEDVFSTPVIAFEEPPESEFEDPSEQPAVAAYTEIVTLPYFVVAQQPNANDLSYPEVYAGALVAQTGADTRTFELYGEVADSLGTLTWQSLGTREIVSRATLAEPLIAEAQTLYDVADFTGMTQGDGPTIAGLAWIGSGDDEDMELVAISAFSTPNYTLERGVLDTVPRAWPAGTPIWFTGVDADIMDTTARSAGEDVDYKILPTTSLGTLAESSASIETETMNERPHMPTRPANAKADGIGFPATPIDLRAVDPIPLTWSNRNRTAENAQMLLWTAAGVTPEAGQTTRIVVMDMDRAVVTVHDGLSGESFDLPHASFGGNSFGIVRFESERAGVFSLQGHEIVVQIGTPTADTDTVTADTDAYEADNG